MINDVENLVYQKYFEQQRSKNIFTAFFGKHSLGGAGIQGKEFFSIFGAERKKFLAIAMVEGGFVPLPPPRLVYSLAPNRKRRKHPGPGVRWRDQECRHKGEYKGKGWGKCCGNYSTQSLVQDFANHFLNLIWIEGKCQGKG